MAQQQLNVARRITEHGIHSCSLLIVCLVHYAVLDAWQLFRRQALHSSRLNGRPLSEPHKLSPSFLHPVYTAGSEKDRPSVEQKVTQGHQKCRVCIWQHQERYHCPVEAALSTVADSYGAAVSAPHLRQMIYLGESLICLVWTWPWTKIQFDKSEANKDHVTPRGTKAI